MDYLLSLGHWLKIEHNQPFSLIPYILIVLKIYLKESYASSHNKFTIGILFFWAFSTVFYDPSKNLYLFNMLGYYL
jgi:hypothetical protein